MPALLDNPNVTSIDGISRQQLLSIRSNLLARGWSEAQALDGVMSAVSAASANLWLGADIRIVRDASGAITEGDASKNCADLGIPASSLPPGEGIRLNESERDSSQRGAPLTFKAIVELSQQQLSSPDMNLPLAAGMQLSAEIVEGRRTVLEYLLSSVRKVADEAGRER